MCVFGVTRFVVVGCWYFYSGIGVFVAKYTCIFVVALEISSYDISMYLSVHTDILPSQFKLGLGEKFFFPFLGCHSHISYNDESTWKLVNCVLLLQFPIYFGLLCCFFLAAFLYLYCCEYIYVICRSMRR